jgi:hypothetical protein
LTDAIWYIEPPREASYWRRTDEDLAGFLCTITRMAVAVTLTSGVTIAGVISFGALTGTNMDPFTSYTENGFAVSVNQGSWFKDFIKGNPAQSIVASPIANGPSITVTDGGGLFSFVSVDLSDNTGPVSGNSTFSFYGYNSGSIQFFRLFSFGGTVTLGSTVSSLPIDTLTFYVSPGISTVPVTSVNIDNIAYTSVVPEPSTFILLCLAGVVGVGLEKVIKRRFGHVV